MKRNGEERTVQHYTTRLAALARFKKADDEELREARQDLQEARLERAILREAIKPTGADIKMDAARRARLAKRLYPEGFKK